MEYIVKRAHLGDKPYSEGETRTAEPHAVRHLVERGILVEKAEPASKNKARVAPKNKAKK